jgi:hypothetical protein
MRVALGMIGLSAERRRRLTHRALPALGGLALVAGGAGMVVGSQAQSSSQRTAGEFAEAWERGDYSAMYDMLDDASREVHTRREFREAYRAAAATATATAVDAGDPEGARDGSVPIPVEVKTRVFGTVRAKLRLPVHDEQVTWGPLLAFPGLRHGEALARASAPPARAPPGGGAHREAVLLAVLAVDLDLRKVVGAQNLGQRLDELDVFAQRFLRHAVSVFPVPMLPACIRGRDRTAKAGMPRRRALAAYSTPASSRASAITASMSARGR